MCIEFAFKRAGIPLMRNFLHQAEGIMGLNIFQCLFEKKIILEDFLKQKMLD